MLTPPAALPTPITADSGDETARFSWHVSGIGKRAKPASVGAHNNLHAEASRWRRNNRHGRAHPASRGSPDPLQNAMGGNQAARIVASNDLHRAPCTALAVDHLAALLGPHAGAKSDAAGALYFADLVGVMHLENSVTRSPAPCRELSGRVTGAGTVAIRQIKLKIDIALHASALHP